MKEEATMTAKGHLEFLL